MSVVSFELLFDMGKQVSIRFTVDESVKRDFDLLLKLKEQTIADNLRTEIERQIAEHADLLKSIRERFDSQSNGNES